MKVWNFNISLSIQKSYKGKSHMYAHYDLNSHVYIGMMKKLAPILRVGSGIG